MNLPKFMLIWIVIPPDWVLSTKYWELKDKFPKSLFKYIPFVEANVLLFYKE